MASVQKSFINKIVPGALKAYQTYNILPSLTMAQAILESAWGKSAIGNNLFGIKVTNSWKGKKQLITTTEYVNGVKTKVKAYFRDYDSIDDSILDHSKILSLARYKPVRQAKDYIEACRQVQKCGYATDPAYATKLINIIRANCLNQYDAIVEAAVTMPKSVLKYGSTGNDVEILQAMLNKRGYKLIVNGKFDVITQGSVKDYQKSNGLVIDGVVGPKTWANLYGEV